MVIRYAELCSCNVDETFNVFDCKKCNCEVIMPIGNDYSFCPYCSEPINIIYGSCGE